MGKDSEKIAASGGSLRTCEAHHVGISPEEDRGGAEGEMGKGTGGEEEGGVATGYQENVCLR